MLRASTSTQSILISRASGGHAYIDNRARTTTRVATTRVTRVSHAYIVSTTVRNRFRGCGRSPC